MEVYCETHGLTVVDRYQDIGSGASRDRAAFKALQRGASTGSL